MLVTCYSESAIGFSDEIQQGTDKHLHTNEQNLFKVFIWRVESLICIIMEMMVLLRLSAQLQI